MADDPATPGPGAASPIPQSSAPSATATPADAAADERARLEVVKQLRGPVAQKFKTLLPELTTIADPYRAILGNPQLLDRAFKTFESRRDAFASFLVDAQGAAVTDDAVRLACGRSVNEVTGMAVRSGMRAFAEQHFSGASRPHPALDRSLDAAEQQRARWIAAVAQLFRRRQDGPQGSPARERVERFYDAIKGSLHHAWQVPLFPVYVEIPAELFAKIGGSIARIDNIEALQRLANLAAADIAKAEQVMGDPALAREMIETNVLASAAVSRMTKEEFGTVHAGLADLEVRRKWDVFANEATALLLGKDKRISEADIRALANHLHMLNEYAVRIIFDLKLARDQFVNFLETAAKNLGNALFVRLFGPIPFFGLDDAATVRRKSYVTFVEGTLKELVAAVQQLIARFKRDVPEAVAECLALVCQSRRATIEAAVAKLVPPPA